jgi:hypothetical protein
MALPDSSDYWPLTVVPSASRQRRITPVLFVIGVLALLGAALTFGVERAFAIW